MKNQFVLSPFALNARDLAMDRLARNDWIVNMPPVDDEGIMARIGSVQRPLADVVCRAIGDGQRPVSVGGDCCQSIAVMAGMRRAGLDPAIVWLDAHGDFNTWETSPSGFIGGMPLAMLVGRGELTLLRQLELEPVAERDVVLCDARDLDAGERENLNGSEVARVTQVSELLPHLPQDRPLYLHFDVDVIDADEAPAMLYPVRGGPTVSALIDVARQIRDTNRLAAVSMTVWALDRDHDRRTEAACMSVLDALVG